MNVIWIVADTLRRDHLGAYGNPTIRTPALDALAAKSVRFDRHYAAGFPTMPARADFFTGRWTMSFMKWEPLSAGVVTLAQILSRAGFHTAGVADTPFFIRHDMNYDRGFQSFVFVSGQEGSNTRLYADYHHESRDVHHARRYESDLNAPRTITRAMEWLELHYREDFFLYIDTWDPHEPWDAPAYYTEPFWPGFDGEEIQPPYGFWQNYPDLSEARVKKAHASYCGEVGMVDTWIGYLLRRVENMGLLEDTAIIFTSDHGFYFGEHGGWFGKLALGLKPDGTRYRLGDRDAAWDFSPLYEELVAAPLLVCAPGIAPADYRGVTSAVDLMPTVLDCMGQPAPDWVEGRSLLPAARDPSLAGREFVVSGIPFANPGDSVRSVDDTNRTLMTGLETTVTTDEWSLIYSVEAGRSELYYLPTDPGQARNLIAERPEVARELHALLVRFMRETNLESALAEPRLKLRL